MPDERQTSSGFEGNCVGSGCTGVLPDEGKGFGNVQTARQDARSITDPDEASKALDAMADAMANASPPDSAAAGLAADSLAQAFMAIAAARSAIAAGDDFSEQMADAAGKTQTYLNMLNAGKLQLAFSKERLTADIVEPIEHAIENVGISFSWLLGLAVFGGAAYIAYKVATK